MKRLPAWYRSPSRAVVAAAILAAPVAAQIRSAPLPLTPLEFVAPSAAPVAATFLAPAPVFAFSAPSLAAPSLAAPVALYSAPLLAAPAAPAALAALSPAAAAAGPNNPGIASAPAKDPAAPLNALFDGITAPKNEILGDPAFTSAVLEHAEPSWRLLSQGGRHRAVLRRALEAGDYTGAREGLNTAARDARRELGARAYESSALRAQFARLDLALNAPDHPAVALLREGAAEARRLKDSGEPARALERVTELLNAYAAGPVSRTEHRHAFVLPLVRLKIALEKFGSTTYFGSGAARAEKLPRTAREIHVWLERRRGEDPASVSGEIAPEPISIQRWSDCALQSLWNLPALSALRARMGSYEKFLDAAEAYLQQSIRRSGMSDGDSRRLLKHWGWDRSYDRAPGGEEALAAEIRAEGGMLASYDFKMPLLTALLTTASFDRSFNHAVAIPAAVFDRGRWWFIVLDSGYAHPRVLTYGELLTLHLEIASVKPLGGS